MKKINRLTGIVLAAMLVLGVLALTACGDGAGGGSAGGGGGEETPFVGITMETAITGNIGIGLRGKGITINWGDTNVEVIGDLVSGDYIPHTYATGTKRTITITGNITHLYCYELNLTSLDLRNASELIWIECYGNSLASLDISNNTMLEALDCHSNSLSSLDVSNNIALVGLGCESNDMDTEALNDLFGTLFDRTGNFEGYIYINNNPGTDDCDITIAEDKNWRVN